MATTDDKDKKIGEVPQLENVTGNEKIPVSANGEPRYIEVGQIREGLQTEGDYLSQKEADKRYATPDDIPNVSDFITGKQAAQKYYPKVDGESLSTQVDTLEFTVETINQGLGEAEQRLTEVEQCNVMAEEVVDDDTLEDFGKLTREQLKKDLFIDLWNDIGGEYASNNTTDDKPFYLNEVLFTYAEAVYNYKYLIPGLTLNRNAYIVPAKSNIKTLTQYYLNEGGALDNPQYYYYNCRLLETIKYIEYLHIKTNIYRTFENCVNLRKIIGSIDVGEVRSTYRPFQGCSKLEEIKLDRLGCDISFQSSPKLNYNSLKGMVINRITVEHLYNQFTITVHPDIYNALLGNATYPFNGGTQEEWEQLLQDAIDKDITFATV